MKIRSTILNIEYVTKEDQKLPKEDQTTFIFRQPTLDEKMRQEEGGDIEVIGDPRNPEGRKTAKTIIKSDKTMKKMVNLIDDCLISITNLVDQEGNVIEWKRKCKIPKKDILSMIYDAIPELYAFILNKSSMSEEEEKNSNSE